MAATPLSTHCLQLVNFAVVYPEFTLEPLSLSFQGGERVAVVGPNGAGKSTMLKALGGRLRDYRGEVLIEGAELRSRLPGVRERLGFLPEEFIGYGWMTVRQHLDFLANFFPAWDVSYARTLLDRLDLSETRQLGTLSKGMRLKLSFVTAEAHRPPYLILDEPTSGLDPIVRHELIEAILAAIANDDRRLVLFSTHILEDVEWIADRVVVLAGGRCRTDAAVGTLRKRDPGRALSQILFDLLRHD